MAYSTIRRKCDHCHREYEADMRNIKRGWGLCCSKSCAAAKREQSKEGYDKNRVEANNIRRKNWNSKYYEGLDDYDPGDSEYWDSKDYN